MIKRFIVTGLSVISLLVALPAPLVSAATPPNPFTTVCQSRNAGGSSTATSSTFCSDSKTATKNDPLTGTNGLIMKIVNIIAFVAGGAAVIIIILAGLRFVSSGGSSEDVAGARRTLIYAAVGLLVLALARQLVAFILGRL